MASQLYIMQRPAFAVRQMIFDYTIKSVWSKGEEVICSSQKNYILQFFWCLQLVKWNTAHVWESTKWKIKVKFMLLFRLLRALYFLEKMRNFQTKFHLWGLKASWNGQIWPPHLCITCFRTFLDICSKNNWMVIFTKKFGTLDLDPPTHSLGQSPK